MDYLIFGLAMVGVSIWYFLSQRTKAGDPAVDDHFLGVNGERLQHLDPLPVKIFDKDGNETRTHGVADPRDVFCQVLNKHLEDEGHYAHAPEVRDCEAVAAEVRAEVRAEVKKFWQPTTIASALVLSLVSIAITATVLLSLGGDGKANSIRSADRRHGRLAVAPTPASQEDAADGSQGGIKFKTEDDILSFDLHPSSQLLLLGTSRGNTHIVNTSDGKARGVPLGKKITSVSWSRDRSRFLANADGMVALWNAKTLRPIFFIGQHVNHGRGMYAVKYGNHGKLTALCFADKVNVLDVHARRDRCRYHLFDRHKIIEHMLFSPDDSKLFASTGRSMACIDTSNGKQLFKRDFVHDKITSSSDGKHFATFGKHGIEFHQWTDKPDRATDDEVIHCQFGQGFAVVGGEDWLRRWDLTKKCWDGPALKLESSPHGIGVIDNKRVGFVSSEGLRVADLLTKQIEPVISVKLKDLHPKLPSLVTSKFAIGMCKKRVVIWPIP